MSSNGDPSGGDAFRPPASPADGFRPPGGAAPGAGPQGGPSQHPPQGGAPQPVAAPGPPYPGSAPQPAAQHPGAAPADPSRDGFAAPHGAAPQGPPAGFAAPPGSQAHAPPAPEGAPRKPGIGRTILIGCGVLALLGLLATLAGGIGLYRAYMENTTEEERGAFREGRALMQDLTEAARRDSASASARSRFSFEAPSSGRLEEGHVRRYAAVQERVWSEMEEPYRAFDERWRAVLQDGAEADRGAGARFVMERGRLEIRRMEALREAQVAERMSDEEYAWIEARILPAWAAITVERTEGRDLTDREQAEASWAAIWGMQAHDADIELLRPHYDTMRAVPMQLFLLGLLPE